VTASGFRAALDNAVFVPLVMSIGGDDITGRYLRECAWRYYWENDAGDMQPQQTRERYDDPTSRTRWQFAPRQEHSFVAEGGE
jgi:hypothetical protein